MYEIPHGVNALKLVNVVQRYRLVVRTFIRTVNDYMAKRVTHKMMANRKKWVKRMMIMTNFLGAFCCDGEPRSCQGRGNRSNEMPCIWHQGQTEGAGGVFSQ